MALTKFSNSTPKSSAIILQTIHFLFIYLNMIDRKVKFVCWYIYIYIYMYFLFHCIIIIIIINLLK